MELDRLPPQVREVLHALASALHRREPALRAKIDALRLTHLGLSDDELARKLIRDSRFRIAATAAASGAAGIAPGLGTLIAVGAVTSQTIYALEQETELVMSIAMLYGHELADSDQRVIEALVVVGIAGGSVKLRENLLVAGTERITVAAFRALPAAWAGRAGGHVLKRILTRIAGSRAISTLGRVAPLAIGMAVGAGFDWISVTALGKAAMAYYGPGGPAARVSLPGQDVSHVKLGS